MITNIVLAEDNNFLAASIKEKLGFFGDLNFCFRGINGKDLIRKLSEHTGPPIEAVLMDIEMPEMDGLEATAVIKEKFPEIKVIILTVFDDEEKIFKAIQSGAMGYMLKDESPDKIYEGIKMVLEGGAPMSPLIAAKTLDILRNPDRLQPADSREDFDLTQRETDVLEQLRKGLNYNEIAENLNVSPFTVRKHIENIYRKLQVKNKMQAVQKAIKHKLI